jgi:cyclohexyl-isocyanide hydratase
LKIAFVIYDGMTALDFIGAYDAVTRLKTMGFLPELEWQVCSYTDDVADNTGLRFTPARISEPLNDFDMVIVPGGHAARELAGDRGFIAWLKTAERCPLKVSVCTGSVLLGAAGFLEGKRATTHPRAFDLLRPFCASVVDERVVDEGDVITARGVSASIDLGLYLCEKLAGGEVKEKIRRQMDYQCSA